MLLRPFYLIHPNDWLFQGQGDVEQAKKIALKDPKKDERHIEEYVRQWVLRELIETYKYPEEWIGERIIIEEKVKMGATHKEADISIRNTGGSTFVFFEIANSSEGGDQFEEKQAQLESYLSARHSATIGLVTNGIETRVLQKKIDPNEFNFIPDIPSCNQKQIDYKKYLVRELTAEDIAEKRETGLEPITVKLEGILFDCHSIIRDVDGLHDDDALDQLSKILFTKIFDENQACAQKEGARFKFQIYGAGNYEEVASTIRDLYNSAREYDLNTNAQKIVGYERSRGVFKSDLKLSSVSIARIVEKLQQYSIIDSDTDIKGRAFQKVLGAAIRAGMGQFFTPHEVVDLIVKMMEPSPTDLILDPFCGSGHFLSTSIDFVDNNYPKLSNHAKFDFRFNRLHGIEKSDRMVRIAMTDMMMHDDGHTNIRCTDALLSFDNYPDIVALGEKGSKTPDVFSLIMTNPPFGSIMQGEMREMIGRFRIAGRKKSLPLEYIAIERCLSFLKPGGKCAIVLPDSIYSNESAQFARSWIMGQAKILATVSLPKETFAPFGTAVKTSILILQRPKKDEVLRLDEPVFMGNIDDVGYDATGRPSGSKQIDELLTAWALFKEGKL